MNLWLIALGAALVLLDECEPKEPLQPLIAKCGEAMHSGDVGYTESERFAFCMEAKKYYLKPTEQCRAVVGVAGEATQYALNHPDCWVWDSWRGNSP